MTHQLIRFLGVLGGWCLAEILFFAPPFDGKAMIAFAMGYGVCVWLTWRLDG